MADKENQGLLHVQEVDLAPSDERTRPPNEVADYPDAIPKEVLRLLWTRQRELANVELVPCEENVDDLIKKIGLDPCSFCERAMMLRIKDVGQGTIPKLAAWLLQLRPINSLTLDFCLLKSNIEEEQNTKRKDNYHSGVLLKNLFTPPCLPTNLKTARALLLSLLTLKAVDLTNCTDLLIKALDTRALKTLRVICCTRPDKLFWKMSKVSVRAKPRLLNLTLYHEQLSSTNPMSDDDRTDRTIKGINEFLLSMTDTVETLWIVVRGCLPKKKLLGPLVPGIINHSSSLLQLTVDARIGYPTSDRRQRVGWFPQDALEQMCAGMERLELLYIPFPPVVANEYRNYTAEFRDYMVCQTLFTAKLHLAPTKRQQATVIQIPTLKTLNITTWPYPLYTEIYDPASRRRDDDHPPYIHRPFDVPEKDTVPIDFYTHCLLYLVDWLISLRSKLVSCYPHRPLEVVGFGMPETGHYLSGLEKYLDPLYFVRVPTVDPKEKTVMRARSFRQMRRNGWCGELILSDWKIERMARAKSEEYEDGYHHE
ncbi:MAG: hypothetical protein Q9210_006132 [Variospora velana]